MANPQAIVEIGTETFRVRATIAEGQRLTEMPQDEGLATLDAVIAPVTLEEASRFKLDFMSG